MIDGLCADMFTKSLLSSRFSWWASYDWKSLEVCPNYNGDVTYDFYGRLHPKHHHGKVRTPMETNSKATIAPLLLQSFDQKTDHRLLFRRLGLIAEGIHEDYGFYQMNLFVDYDALEREKSLQGALAEIRTRFGMNGIFTGKNMLGGATQLERNAQIGGHRA